MKPPQLLARFGVVSGYVTAKRRNIRASMSYNDLAIENARSACDVADFLIVIGLRGPYGLACAGIDGDQPAIGGTGVDLAIPVSDATHAPVISQAEIRNVGNAGIVIPERLPRYGIGGANNAEQIGRAQCRGRGGQSV